MQLTAENLAWYQQAARTSAFSSAYRKTVRQKLLEYLKMLTTQDPQHPRIVDMTPLGLVEITRKKSHPTLAEQWKKI